jgi:hypothetical protein
MIAPILSIATVALLAVPTVVAKEFIEVTLDAPIAMGTPGGTEILVGLSVVTPDPETGELHPVEGSPVYVRLTGRDGATTRAIAAGDPLPGHYTARITIPAGGARDIEVGIDGTSDMPMVLAGDPFAPGQITARTAQLAPPASSAPVDPAPPVADAAEPAAEPAPTPTVAEGPVAPPELLVALVAVGALAVVALAAAVVARRRRTPDAAPRSA